MYKNYLSYNKFHVFFFIILVFFFYFDYFLIVFGCLVAEILESLTAENYSKDKYMKY